MIDSRHEAAASALRQFLLLDTRLTLSPGKLLDMVRTVEASLAEFTDIAVFEMALDAHEFARDAMCESLSKQSDGVYRCGDAETAAYKATRERVLSLFASREAAR